MATLGKYCKAYPLQALRAYPGWSERAENARRESQTIDGQLVTAARPLHDDDCVYVQEDYTVTDGIFKDENVIFDRVTAEWIDYCGETLHLEIPDYEPSPATR